MFISGITQADWEAGTVWVEDIEIQAVQQLNLRWAFVVTNCENGCEMTEDVDTGTFINSFAALKAGVEWVEYEIDAAWTEYMVDAYLERQRY